MGNLSTHFDSSEFDCACGCGGGIQTSELLISMLEKLHKSFGAQAVIITSGYRDPDYSVSVGGYRNDAHTLHIAADIKVKVKGDWVSSWDIAATAEELGFKGIGIIDDTACHVDTRGYEPYSNSFWFGNEVTGESYSTFKDKGKVWTSGLENPAAMLNTHNIKLIIDGETVVDKEIT